MNLRKRIAAAALVLTLLPVSGFAADAPRFSDVPAGAWYADAVQACAETGLMTGRADGAFDPMGAVTCAEAAAMAARVHALTHGGADIPAAREGELWWAGAAHYLDESGALAPIKGVKTPSEYYNFLPDTENALLSCLDDHDALHLTQEEIDQEIEWGWEGSLYARRADETATRLFFLLLAACAVPEEQLAGGAGVTSLPDYRPELEAYSPVYEELVLRLYNAGVVTGGDEWGMLRYSDPLTRAEAAALLVRLTDESRRQAAAVTPLPGELEPVSADALFSSSDYEYVTLRYDEETDTSSVFYDPDGLADQLTNGVLPARRKPDGLFGYRDTHGSWIVEPRFDWADAFGPYAVAAAVENGSWVLVDKAGRTTASFGMVDTYYVQSLTVLSDQLVLLQGHNALSLGDGLYRADGTALIPMGRLAYAEDAFTDGLFWAGDYGEESLRYGAVDETGKWVIPQQYAAVFPFYEGRAAVLPPESEQYQIIDTVGTVLTDNFADGMIIKYTRAGLYAVSLAGSWDHCGVIDSSGRIIVPMEYSSIRLVGQSYIVASKRDASMQETTLYYDHTGNPLTEEQAFQMQEPLEARFVPPLPGPYGLRRKGNDYALFSASGTQLTPYLFGGEPLWLPGLNQYLVAIHGAAYLYSPAA